MEGDLMKNFLKKYGHLWILGYGFIYLPGLFTWRKR